MEVKYTFTPRIQCNGVCLCKKPEPSKEQPPRVDSSLRCICEGRISGSRAALISIHEEMFPEDEEVECEH